MATQTFTGTLHVLECASCAMAFGVTADFERRRREDHKNFFCPLGHNNRYPYETDAERLASELKTQKDITARKQAALDQALAYSNDLRERVEHKSRQINGYKGAMARTKRRVANGRCPCCSEQFKNLESHMKNRHPHWNPDKHADAIAVKAG